MYDCFIIYIKYIYFAYANSFKVTTMTFKIKQSIDVNRDIIMSLMLLKNITIFLMTKNTIKY